MILANIFLNNDDRWDFKYEFWIFVDFNIDVDILYFLLKNTDHLNHVHSIHSIHSIHSGHSTVTLLLFHSKKEPTKINCITIKFLFIILKWNWFDN